LNILTYFINYLNLIGTGYNSTTDSDILLLEISNIDEYKWIKITSPSSPNNIPTILGTVIGSLIGSISLLFGGLFIYKRNKNKRKNKIPIPTPGSDEINNYNHEDLTIPIIRNINNHEKEKISETPAINNGQEMLQMSENKYLTNNEVYYYGLQMLLNKIRHLKMKV